MDRQLAALTAAGCIRVFADKRSGKNAEREELWKALDYLRPGDPLVVASLDRLGRSLSDLISIVTGLRRRGIGFASLHESLDTTTPGGRLVFPAVSAGELGRLDRSPARSLPLDDTARTCPSR